jgi:hypothetical protein
VSGEFRDRITEVIYVRDRYDGLASTTADAILAMPEMQAIRKALFSAYETIDQITPILEVEWLWGVGLPQSVIDWVLDGRHG